MIFLLEGAITYVLYQHAFIIYSPTISIRNWLSLLGCESTNVTIHLTYYIYVLFSLSRTRYYFFFFFEIHPHVLFEKLAFYLGHFIWNHSKCHLLDFYLGLYFKYKFKCFHLRLIHSKFQMFLFQIICLFKVSPF